MAQVIENFSHLNPLTLIQVTLKKNRECFNHSKEEFRIIGFYLYHVTSIRPSNSMAASGSLTASLNIDYDRVSSSYYC